MTQLSSSLRPPRPRGSNKLGHVYILWTEGQYKIGGSQKLVFRLKSLDSMIPTDLWVLGYIKNLDIYGLEADLHGEFESVRQKGEWFRLSKLQVIKLMRRDDLKIINLPVSEFLQRVR